MKQQLCVTCDDLEWIYTQDWVYHEYGECKRHLQLIIPYRNEWKKEERFPLILFIPGSAWLKQEMYNPIPEYAKWAERGYVFAAMEYRESELATFPAQVEDVCNAFEFIETIVDQFHIDRNRIFLAGNSSGGHIALMTMLFHAHGLCKLLPKLSGVISESGPTDLVLTAKSPLPPWMKVRPTAALIGVDQIEGNEELAEKASCSRYITEETKLPPILLLHTEGDPVVSVENSRILHQKLEETNHEVTYYELVGDTHGGAVFWEKDVLDVIDHFCKTV